MGLTSEYLREQFTRHWPFLEQLALSRFIDENLAHEAMLYIADKIEADDYKRLKSFSGKSSIKTFLAVVAKRLFDDFARQRFGRVRPPEWLKQRGGLWLEIFRKLCLERNSPMEVAESFAIVNPTSPDPKLIEEAVQIILSKITDCGKNTINTVVTDSEQTDERGAHTPELHQMTPEEFCHACEREDFITILSGAVSGEMNTPAAKQMKETAATFNQALKLSAEERLFLKTVYQEGLSVSAAGRMLGWNANQSSGKHRRIMEKLKGAIASSGMLDKVNDFFSD